MPESKTNVKRKITLDIGTLNYHQIQIKTLDYHLASACTFVSASVRLCGATPAGSSVYTVLARFVGRPKCTRSRPQTGIFHRATAVGCMPIIFNPTRRQRP